MYLSRVPARSLRRRQFRLLLTAVLVASLALPVAGALAARGGQNKGGKTPPAVLTVTPDPVAAGGATYTVEGHGFTPNTRVSINEATPGCCLVYNVYSDADGRVEFTRTTGKAGTYTITAKEKKKRRLVLMAEVTFEVVGG